jgi:hypothetical protein
VQAAVVTIVTNVVMDVIHPVIVSVQVVEHPVSIIVQVIVITSVM